jgi:plasmid stabilization system protein ParE
MAHPLLIHPKAVEEAQAARRWYEQRSQRVAAGFVRELDRTMSAVAESPDRWPIHAHGTRKLILRRFPFAVIYKLNGDEVWVIAVAHGRRHPAYWQTRTK